MSETQKECSAEYCNFQEVYENGKHKHLQCVDCGYILTEDDIQRELDMAWKHFNSPKEDTHATTTP